jgi:phosphoesterase RecJ-like protein
MTNSDSIAALLDLLRERNTFIITSHSRPDGDAIGSSLGFMHLLEALGKHVTVVFSDSIPEIYRSLPGVDRILTHLPSTTPDAAVFLECDSLDRSGFDLKEYASIVPALTINIDHHSSGREFATFNWIDSQAPAVGTMVYDLAIASGIHISTSMAACLYAAVLTDTGSFRYPGVTASTFGMAQHLVECGADPNAIAQAVFFSNPPAKVRLLGIALSKMRMESLTSANAERNGSPVCPQVAWTAITLNDMALADATIEDCEGLVSFLIGIAGVEAAVFLRELPSGNGFRLSLRSKNQLNIAVVAEHFGGGGHRNASGCTVAGPLGEVTARVVARLRLAASPSRPAAPAPVPAQPATLLA